MTSSPERSAAYSQWQSGGGFETLGDFEPWWSDQSGGTTNVAAPAPSPAASPASSPSASPSANASPAPLPLAPDATPNTGTAQTGQSLALAPTPPANAVTPPPLATPDPLAFAPSVPSGNVGGFGSGGMLSPTPAIPATTAPLPAQPFTPTAPSPTTPAPATAAVGSGSQIFANDPTRPGAGYVMVNGVPYRIEGTTAAGLNPDGSPKAVGGSQYLLDDGNGNVINGPSVNESDYNAWVNAPHGADTAGGPSGSAPPPAPAPTPTPAPAPTPQPTPAPSGSALTASAGQGINEANPRAPTPSPAPSLPGGSLSGGTLDPHPAIPSPTPIPSQPTAPSGPVETAPPQPTDGNGLPVASAPPAPAQTPAPAPSPAPTPTPAPSSPPLTVPPPVQAPVPLDANGLPSQSASQTGNQGTGVSLSPTTPGNSLLNSTITPGPGTDRYAIAQKEYNDWVAQSDPQFQASMRDANRYSAAAGRIGSGQATNSIGDIQTQRENAMRSSRDTFLGNALNSSVEDAYRNVGIDQQQQQFQEGQQQTGFNQNIQLQTLANSEQGQQFSQLMQSLGFNAQQIQQAFQNAYATQQLSNSQDAQSFYQALQQEILGMQGDPAQILAWISGQYARGAAA